MNQLHSIPSGTFRQIAEPITACEHSVEWDQETFTSYDQYEMISEFDDTDELTPHQRLANADLEYQFPVLDAMGGLDRQLIEDCHGGSGHIQRPGLNIPQIARHLRPEWLETRIQQADLADCEVLAECFRTLEATPAMVNQFIIWINKGDIDKGIAYFTDLTYQLAVIDNPESVITDAPAEAMVDYSRWAERNTWEGCTAWAKDDSADDWTYHIEDRHMPNNREFAYVTIGNDLGEDDWLDQQPAKYQNIIRKMGRLNYIGLKQLAMRFTRHCGAGKFTDRQAQAFWGHYRKFRKIKRSAIMSKPVVNALLTRIRNTDDRKVRFVGFWLYDQQAAKGQTPPWGGAKQMIESDWSLIWEHYRQRKAALPGAKASAALDAHLNK